MRWLEKHHLSIPTGHIAHWPIQRGIGASPEPHDQGTEAMGQTLWYTQIQGRWPYMVRRQESLNCSNYAQTCAQEICPFKVIQVMSPVNYHLELPTQWSIHSVFHINLLTPYWETITHSANYQHPPPDLVDNEEEYKVEKILDSQLFCWCKWLQYLVKWKGYPDSHIMSWRIYNGHVKAHVQIVV